MHTMETIKNRRRRQRRVSETQKGDVCRHLQLLRRFLRRKEDLEKRDMARTVSDAEGRNGDRFRHRSVL